MARIALKDKSAEEIFCQGLQEVYIRKARASELTDKA